MSSKKLPYSVMILFAVFFLLSAIVLNIVAGRVENGGAVRVFALVDALAAAAIFLFAVFGSLRKE